LSASVSEHSHEIWNNALSIYMKNIVEMAVGNFKLAFPAAVD
jgi:hypothetical protein